MTITMLVFRHLMSLPPRETWRLLSRRLPVLRNRPVWRPLDLLTSQKHRSGIRFAELLLRQEAAVAQKVPWKPLEFEGQRVVEIGCGPLGGYGPLAIFRGAEVFESAEPEWDPELMFSKEIEEGFLYILHADLVALYGERMDFASFRDALRTRLTVHRTGFESAPLEEKADIVLSQSCLEHVFPLDGTVEKLAAIQHGTTRFLHLVDFGNHYFTPNPFEGLYDHPPEAYIAKRGRAINLLRVSDVASAFAEHGIAAHIVPTRVVPETYRGKIHPWWRERYDDAALFTQLAIVAG